MQRAKLRAAASLERLKTELAERSLYEFSKQAWHLVEPAEFRDNWHIGCICEHLQAVTAGEIERLVLNMPPRHMKAIANRTVIPTPTGYRKHGEICPGDYVFGPDGCPTKVLRISEEGVMDYDVTFSTGETINCNGDHLWTVYDRWSQKWKTLDTRSIASCEQEQDRCRFFIPDEPCLEFACGKDLLLHPYFLGCWLGDGTSTEPSITHDVRDREHLEKMRSLGYWVTAKYPQVSGNAVRSTFRRQGVLEKIRSLGLYDNKRIPEVYATSSVDDRLELLAGLIDTDGHVEKKSGRVRISTCSKTLAEDIRRLALSLGFRSYILTADSPGYGKYRSTGKVYQVGFQPTQPIPTALPRKKINRLNPTRRMRAITSVKTSADPGRGRCLTVDRDDGLYVVGETNLVTHNSLQVCVFWFCHTWATWPDSRWLYTSYSESFAQRDAQKARNIIRSEWYQARWGDRFQIKSDEDTKGRYVNDKFGHRVSTSIGGKGTGEGGNIIVSDDPHKIEEIESEAAREAVLRWWDGTMATRGNVPGQTRRVIVMQRLHDADLSGHVLAGELDYEHLCLPGRYEKDRIVYSWPDGMTPNQVRRASAPDVIVPTSLQMKRPELRDPRTEEGELLWKSRFDEKGMREIELPLGPWGVAGQVQQRPNPPGGGVIKSGSFQYYTEDVAYIDGVPVTVFVLQRRDGRVKKWMSHQCRWFQTCDTALKTGQENDYTAIGTYVQTPDNELLVHDIYNDRVEVPYQLGTLLNMRLRYPQLLFQAVEDKQAGTGLIDTGRLRGTPFRILKADDDKMRRAAPVATMYENGMVFHRANQAWLPAFERQITKVPKAEHDDMFDTLAYAGQLMTTDALLEQINSVEDFFVYPSRQDAAEKARRAGMTPERYDLIYGDLEDGTYVDDF